MPQKASGFYYSEREPGGGSLASGSGRLFFFDTAERGPDLAQDLDLDGFRKRYGENSRAAKLARLYFAQRSPFLTGRGAGPITFARVRSSTAVKAFINVVDRTPVTPVNTVKFEANGYGTYGNSISVVVTDGRVTDTVDLSIRNSGVQVELITSLNMNRDDAARYLVNKVNNVSNWIRAVDLTPSDTYQATDNPANGTYTLASGSDGGAIGNTDYTDALARFAQDSVAKGGILYTPIPSVTVATAMLAHGLYRYSMIDCPSGQTFSANKTYKANFNSSAGELVRGEGYTNFAPFDLLPLTIVKAAQQLILDFEKGQHYIASNYPMLGIDPNEGLEAAYTDDLGSKATEYELEGITTFRRLPGGGFGAFGLSTLSPSTVFGWTGVRRSFYHFEQGLQAIVQPQLHQKLNNASTWADIDGQVASFMNGEVTRKGMVSSPIGTPVARDNGWAWKADATTTSQAVLDDGGLIGLFGAYVPRALRYVEVELSEFTAPTVSETVTEGG